MNFSRLFAQVLMIALVALIAFGEGSPVPQNPKPPPRLPAQPQPAPPPTVQPQPAQPQPAPNGSTIALIVMHTKDAKVATQPDIVRTLQSMANVTEVSTLTIIPAVTVTVPRPMANQIMQQIRSIRGVEDVEMETPVFANNMGP
ncbi:hypothetical protein BKA69DRAFT_1128986 [Paraphysoderma sedebokerense]|nr:hypothetical protein BKA69DRAFT_1128986 [Paraphysoderma sedebokerense]